MMGGGEEFEPSSALLAKSRHFAGKSGESNPRSHSTTEAALSQFLSFLPPILNIMTRLTHSHHLLFT